MKKTRIKMENEFFTLLLVPDRKGKSFRWRIKEKNLKRVLALSGCFVALIIGFLFYTVYVFSKDIQTASLMRENKALKIQLKNIEKKMVGAEKKLSTVAAVEGKLRSLTLASNGDPSLTIGSNPSTQIFATKEANPLSLLPLQDNLGLYALEAAVLESRFDGIVEETERQLQSLSQLVDYFSEQKLLLASTPSLWPTAGWISSNFGPRADPFTGVDALHVGIDIAAREGAKVIAPAAGKVLFVGERGGYGNAVLLDHGYGLVTHYGHLSNMRVKIGDFVKRGDVIAWVGNSGRSTNPHLHYEVRKDGLPVNPRRFIIY